MENKSITKVLQSGRYRISKTYDTKIKPNPANISTSNQIFNLNKSVYDIAEEKYNNKEWSGIIDKYVIMNEEENVTDITVDNIEELLDKEPDKYLQGILLDDQMNILHGISTSIILYITNDWVYTKSGSLYKLINKF